MRPNYGDAERELCLRVFFFLHLWLCPFYTQLCVFLWLAVTKMTTVMMMMMLLMLMLRMLTKKNPKKKERQKKENHLAVVVDQRREGVLKRSYNKNICCYVPFGSVILLLTLLVGCLLDGYGDDNGDCNGFDGVENKDCVKQILLCSILCKEWCLCLWYI